MKFVLIVAVALSFGCSAEFTDLRPEDEDPGNNVVSANAQTTGQNNGNTADAGGNGANNTSADAGNTDDATGGGNNTTAGEETLIASGDFVNVDYQTAGSAQYWQLADGSYEVRLSMDFASQGVPGPALALSPRNPLGGSIDSDELDLGALDADSGAQSYALPREPTDFLYTWIWCKPFGLDVAYAEMEFQ